MSADLVFRPEAEAELEEAFEWYQKRRAGLGFDFLRRVDEALDRVRRDPESLPLVYRSARQILLRQFPFAVYFTVSAEKITVIAVFHGSRDPKAWQARA